MSRDPAGLSLWLDQLDEDLRPRDPLRGNADADVAIVGGGFTGLWIAYYLSALRPELEITILEKDFCGFGASGRNGGWCVGELVADIATYAKRSSPEAALAQQRLVFDSVDEVGRIAEAEDINCGFQKGGTVYLARNDPQAKRQREGVAYEHEHGLTEDDIRLLSANEARSIANATEVRSGIYFAHTASLDPAALVRGLADACRSRGVTIHEGTTVEAIEPSVVRTSHGIVRAPVILRATEGYTRNLSGERRTLVPLYSLMVATEPLDQSVFDEIGLADRPTFADGRYAVIYGQRTADDRIAFGGRGVPYLFGSRIDPKTEQHGPTHDLIEQTLIELFPVLREAKITHRWGGVLGAPRNFTPSVNFDPATGFGWAGGYVGEGVAAANLAGRTMAALVGDTDDGFTTLPWVNAESRRWEPEPLRWLGVWGTRRVMFAADRREYETQKESKAGVIASQLL